MFVMYMIGAGDPAAMGSWRTMIFLGLTAEIRISKHCRKLSWNPSYYPASSFMFALGKNDCNLQLKHIPFINGEM